MKHIGIVTWTDGVRLEIDLPGTKTKPDIKVYCDWNQDRFKRGEQIVVTLTRKGKK